MNKRGISPLIATVLIIGFTVVLGVVVYSFITSTVREGIMDAETRTELGNLCLSSNVEYKVDCHLGPYLKLRANNNGLEDIKGVLVNIIRSDGSDVLASNISLGPYGGKTFYAMFGGVAENIEKVKFSPRFDLNNNTYDCTGFVEIDTDNLPMCEDYLQNNKGESLISPAPSPPLWDPSLHNDAVFPEVWDEGYNSGVGIPDQGYHAKWVNGEGFDNSVGMKMVDDNCALGYFCGASGTSSCCNRWLGISQRLATDISLDLPDWNDGDNITLSFYAKTDDSSKWVDGGIYHKDLAGNNLFGSARNHFTPDELNEWGLYHFTFIYDTSSWLSTGPARLYIYGQNPGLSTGIVWYDNVQVFKTPTIV